MLLILIEKSYIIFVMKANLYFCYRIVRWFFQVLFKRVYHGKLYGVENIPEQGGFILAGNHVSYLDPPLIAVHCWRQPVYSFARKTLFKFGIGWFFKRLYMLPVDRDKGSDLRSIKDVLNRLKNNQPVLMFPEGTRSATGVPQRAKKGIGLFIQKAQVPVVPVRVFGTFEAWPKTAKWPSFKPNIAIVFGEPLLPQQFADCASEPNPMQAMSDKVMQAIATLRMP